MSKGKWKSVITIWSDFDPNKVELSTLAREAEEGMAICTDLENTYVENPEADPAYEGAGSFFNDMDEDIVADMAEAREGSDS